jgi:hypothetical protein
MLTLQVIKRETHRCITQTTHIWTFREQCFVKQCLDSGEDIIVWASHKDIALSTFREPDKSHQLGSGT